MINYLLMIAKCAYPSAHDGSNMQVVDYVAPALEGSEVRFSCSPELVLTGPNESTCAGNGEWEPDPSQARCKGMNSGRGGPLPVQCIGHITNKTFIVNITLKRF